MDLIECQCGQRFSAVGVDGQRRIVCPVCRRPIHGNKTREPTPHSAVEEEQILTGWIRLLAVVSLGFAILAGIIPSLMVAFSGFATATVGTAGPSIAPQAAIVLAAAIAALLGAVLHFLGGIGLLARSFWAWHAMLLSAVFLAPSALYLTFTFAQRPPETATTAWFESIHYATLGIATWPVAFFLMLCISPIRTRILSYR